MTIEVRGSLLSSTVNGKPAVKGVDDSRLPPAGFLALATIDPLSVIHFKKIEIREFPPVHGDNVPAWGAIVDPERDCKFKCGKDAVQITIPGGHHNLNPAPPFQNLSAPRILRRAPGNFAIEVTVPPFARPRPKTSTTKENSYVGAGLLLWHDSNNFVRFFRAANGDSGRVVVSVEVFENGKAARWKDDDVPDGTVVLRIERPLGVCSFRYRVDDADWKHLANGAPAFESGDLEAGIAATNSTTQPHTAEFRNLQIKSLP
jgi:hypothetical protein